MNVNIQDGYLDKNAAIKVPQLQSEVKSPGSLAIDELLANNT